MTNETNLREVITKPKDKDGKQRTLATRFVMPTLEALTQASEELQTFALDCLFLGASGKVRNHLVSGRIANDPDGKVTLEQVLQAQKDAAEAAGARGEALARYRELQEGILAYATAQGINPKGVATLRKLISSPQVLELATERHRQRAKQFIEGYASTLDEDTLALHADALEKLLNACDAGGTDEDDF